VLAIVGEPSSQLIPPPTPVSEVARFRVIRQFSIFADD